MNRSVERGGGARPIRICFWFNAQRHQLLHGIATAAALSRQEGYEVTVASPSADHIHYAERLASKLGGEKLRYVVPKSPVMDRAWRHFGGSVPPKLLSLMLAAPWLNRFDAIAIPERTSLILRKMGVTRPEFIHLDHGAGDRAIGFDRRIRLFDFVLMAGDKHRDRLLREGLIRPGAYAVVGYPKFEAADAARDAEWNPFPGDDRPVVLYNPHFSTLGSWQTLGEAVLEAFAAQDRYNLIVAPHVRLLDGDAARARWQGLIDRYADHPRILIDPGSDRSIDMSYTSRADIYLGDVSSQVYEFLRASRPCLFLNANHLEWSEDENYLHWHFGPVLDDCAALIAAVDDAVRSHPFYAARQRAGFVATFSDEDTPASIRAATAIATHLRSARSRPWRRTSSRRPEHAPSVGERVRCAIRKLAVVAPAVVGGWLLHDFTQPTPIAAAPDSFVDEAVASHEILLLRDVMRSQPETRDFEPKEIQAATGIQIPKLPANWTVLDVQIFPSDIGPSVQLMIETAGHGRFTMAAMRRVDTPAEGKPLLDRRKGERIAFWEENGFAYALVGQESAASLLQLASQVAEES
ncbi:MAG: hypothetical protein V4618_20510 [Pseudomonadota bacterium]